MEKNNITLNKYEVKEYSESEEERAVMNLLEDLNVKFQEIEESNRVLNQTQKAVSNILHDSISLNEYIKKESSKTEAILKNMTNGLYVVDLNEEIMLFNAMAEKMFGWSQSEVLGKKDSDIFPIVRFATSTEPDPHGLPYMIHSAWKNGQTINLSFVVLQSNKGNDLVVSISAAPILDENQKVTSGVIVLKDMRHEFEVDRAKTEFVSVASHQLRTPLAAIKWFLELIMTGDTGPISESQKDFLTQISDSTERMIDLVNSLLNVSRIETGRITIEPEPTDLVMITEKATKELIPIFQKRKQIFKLNKPSKELPKITIDPKLISEVIINLLSNASKYTPEDGSVTINIEQVDDSILFRVSDTGYGIPAHQQHRLFEKFFRGENIVKYSTEGTGLGLYIVKAIVESSGGKIWFESEENKGSTFYFTLPISGSPSRKGEKGIESTRRIL